MRSLLDLLRVKGVLECLHDTERHRAQLLGQAVLPTNHGSAVNREMRAADAYLFPETDAVLPLPVESCGQHMPCSRGARPALAETVPSSSSVLSTMASMQAATACFSPATSGLYMIIW